MIQFMIDPKGRFVKIPSNEATPHIDYFREHFVDYINERKMKRFVEFFQRPDEDLKEQFENLLEDMADEGEYEKFYMAASEIGYLCGQYNHGEDLALRLNDYDCIADSHVKPLLEIIIKKKIRTIVVDVISKGNYESLTQNEFFERL